MIRFFNGILYLIGLCYVNEVRMFVLDPLNSFVSPTSLSWHPMISI